MKSDAVFLKHILENIGRIESSVGCMPMESFESEVDLVDATLRRLEVIGEAVKNISEKTKNANPSVEWRKIAATRDKLIHFYFGVDTELVYNIIANDLPVLKSQIKGILEKGMK